MRLTLEDVGFAYPQQPAATLFDGLCLQISAGEFLAVVGSSGSGKSTLLHLAAGLLDTDRGRIVRPARRSLMFQTHALLPWLRVIDNVALGLEARGLGAAERRRQAASELERFGLAADSNRFPGQLSVGMQQRVALARALVVQPDLLLLDEPFAALDAATRRVLQRDLIRRWESDGTAVVLVTHDLDEAILLADRVVVLGGDVGEPTRIVEDSGVPEPRRCFDAQSPEAARELRIRLWSRLEAQTRARMRVQS